MRNASIRHKLILELLDTEGYVTVPELSSRLNVSGVTIRKDLKYLEGKKLLQRNHGSASILSPTISERHIDVKEKLFMEQKARIAQAANSLIVPNDKILIASGTTLLAFANSISIDGPLTVITSSLKVSLALFDAPNIEVIQMGGVLRKNAASVVGHYSESILVNFCCDKLFIGVDGISMDYGLTTSNVNEATLNQEMIKAAQKVIVLTDSSKFGERGFCKICNFNKIHHIITDTDAPQHMIDAIRDKNIEVTLV